jgi:tetratricopeptide (TPR) repeat protein
MILVKRPLFLVALGALAPLASAQDWKGTGRLEGRVLAAGGDPVEGARVKLELPERGGGTTLKTDKKGRWAIFGVAAGSWNLDVEAEGYAPRKISVRLPSESSRLAPIEVKLERGAAAAGSDTQTREAFERAEAAYKAGRFADARAEYGKLLALRPDLAPRIHQQIGFALIQEKQPREAVAELKKVLEAEPDNPQVRAIAAQAALEGGLVEEGRALLAGLGEAALKEPDAAFNIGVNFLNAGATGDAEQYFGKAIALDPSYVDGYFQRGLARLKLGRMEEARGDFRKVVELAPSGAQAELARKALQQLP